MERPESFQGTVTGRSYDAIVVEKDDADYILLSSKKRKNHDLAIGHKVDQGQQMNQTLSQYNQDGSSVLTSKQFDASTQMYVDHQD